MATYKNISGADFTLPDGRTIRNLEVFDMNAKIEGIPGVMQFIEAGKLEKQEPEKPKRGRPAKTTDEPEVE